MPDLNRLLSPDKFLPFFVARKDQPADCLPPVAVEFHWTSNCNYNCVHCSYGERRRSKGVLPEERIRSVVSDLIAAGTSAVYFSGGGEPTVVKTWPEHATTLLDAGVEVALITNGVALRETHAGILSRMNYVAVSIYSTDPAEYEAITASRFFDRQWEAPALIKASGGKVTVGARCVVNTINKANLVNIHDRARAAGYDYVIFVPAVDYEGKGVGLGPEDRQWIRDLVVGGGREFDPAFSNLVRVVERGVRHYAAEDYRDGMNGGLPGCTAIRIRSNAFINYCGGVWLCQPHIGDPEYRIGDVLSQDFRDIWNSPRHAEVAERMDRRFAEGACRNCRSIGFNRAAHDYMCRPFVTDIADPFL